MSKISKDHPSGMPYSAQADMRERDSGPAYGYGYSETVKVTPERSDPANVQNIASDAYGGYVPETHTLGSTSIRREKVDIGMGSMAEGRDDA
jgi:hypothetical protein